MRSRLLLSYGRGDLLVRRVPQTSGWSDSQILRRVAWRGFALFLVGQLLENPILFLQSFLKPPAVAMSSTMQPPPIDGSALYWGFIVMTGLGLVMMCCSLLLRWGPVVWGLAALACVLATNLLLPASGKPGPLWETILLAPGLRDHIIVMYPVLPWLAVSTCGMLFGLWWRKNPVSAPRQVPLAGLGLLLTGVLLRAAGGFGNIRLPRDGSWIEFLNTVKYPPSLVFWTMSLGLNLLILSLLLRLPDKVKSPVSPLIVFGQTPAFFYVAHLYLLALIAFSFFREAAPLSMVYVAWAAALVILFPLCRWYRGFKSTKPPESLWRLF